MKGFILFLTVILAGVFTPLAVATDGNWKLDEGSGTSAADSSGNDNDGTLINGPTWVAGKIGQAVLFDGSNDHIEIDPPETAATTAVSLAAWVWRTADQSGIRGVMSQQRGTGDDERYMLYFNSNIARWWVDTIGTDNVVANTGVSPNGEWIHLAGTYEASTTKLYVNGTLVASATATAEINGAGTRPLIIGANHNDNTSSVQEAFGGRVDDARIYDRALTAAEVSTLAAGPPNWQENDDLQVVFPDDQGDPRSPNAPPESPTPGPPTTCAAAATALGSDLLLCQDFDSQSLGDWNLTELQAAFPNTTGWISGPTNAPDGGSNGRITVVDATADVVAGKSIKVKYPANKIGGNSGLHFHAPIGVSGLTEAYLGYWVRFDPEFPNLKGGKLPGLTGGVTDDNNTGISGGRKVLLGKGFSSRNMFVGGRRITNYFMWMENPRPPKGNHIYGDGPSKQFNWEPGKWYFIEQHVKLNTLGLSDGVLEVWINGERTTNYTNWKARATGQNYIIRDLQFSTHLGGNDSGWFWPEDVFTYFDTILVSRARIGG